MPLVGPEAMPEIPKDTSDYTQFKGAPAAELLRQVSSILSSEQPLALRLYMDENTERNAGFSLAGRDNSPKFYVLHRYMTGEYKTNVLALGINGLDPRIEVETFVLFDRTKESESDSDKATIAMVEALNKRIAQEKKILEDQKAEEAVLANNALAEKVRDAFTSLLQNPQ